jgi:hypothetical protein
VIFPLIGIGLFEHQLQNIPLPTIAGIIIGISVPGGNGNHFSSGLRIVSLQ